MKRLLLGLSFVLITLASIVFAQTASQITFRTPAGDKPVATTQQNGQTLFAADDIAASLGGTMQPQGSGFSVTVNNVSAVFGTDSRFAVVREDLIEMPAAPIVIEGKPYAALSFFQGFLSRAMDLEMFWDPSARVLHARPQQRTAVSAQVSVANVEGITKVVITLTAPVEYTILRSQTTTIVRFRTPVRGQVAEQAYEDPHVAKTAFAGNDFRITLAAADVVSDSYKLDNPFRIVLDFRKAASAPATPLPTVVAPRQMEDQPGIRTIVIDPGHGGKDVGAVGPAGTMEKDLTLSLCRRLASALEAKTGARVVLTREDDSIVALDSRPALANQYKADLFLSVHMNAAVVKGARGSETYFLSPEASDELARRAAETENAAGRLSGGDSSGDLKLILWDLAQQEYMQESSRFASDIQEEMNAIAGITNRGVKQAPFKVLVGATMPAALVEVAFITNPEEEAKLTNEKFVSNVVDALVRAVVRYKTDYETRLGIIRPAAAPATPAVATPAPATATAGQTTGKGQ